MRIRMLALGGVVGLSVVAAVGGIGATAAGAHTADQSCGPAHRYIDAKTATVKAHRVVIHGRHARLHCGGPDDSSYISGSKVTLRMLKTGTIKVWRMYEDPSQGRRKIAATDLPHWLKKNYGEPIYKIHGPADGVTSLVEEWHP